MAEIGTGDIALGIVSISIFLAVIIAVGIELYSSPHKRCFNFLRKGEQSDWE